MTALEQVKEWLATFPQFDILTNFRVDYTEKVPGTGGILPDGLVEVSRRRDITGCTTVTNQYNFALYYVFEKAPGDDEGAEANADWIVDLQEWAQAQSVSGAAPVFGDDPRSERITAQKGTLYQAEEEGTAVYVVQLSVQFVRVFKEENKWMI